MTNIQKLKDKIITLNKCMAIVLGINIMLMIGIIIAIFWLLAAFAFLITLGTITTPVGAFASISLLIGLLLCYGIYKPYTKTYLELLKENRYKDILTINIISFITQIGIIIFAIIKAQQMDFMFYLIIFIPTILIYLILTIIRISMVWKMKKLTEDEAGETKNDEFTK